MTTALGPYEPHGAYGVLAESEVFDVSGTGIEFCPSCEHEPCVAGGVEFCTQRPRFISVEILVREIRAAADRQVLDSTPLYRALNTAINRIEGYAWFPGHDGDRAIWSLVVIRDHLAAPADGEATR